MTRPQIAAALALVTLGLAACSKTTDGAAALAERAAEASAGAATIEAANDTAAAASDAAAPTNVQ